ncbi:MAG: DNA repair protein RecO, partial [Hyphomicrobiales bacterium]|nr:DNA repair protein RecO [Hyphomicrobiales bacterium]
MEWRDCGIVLSVRPHGESSALLELLTHGHGRHMGLVRGGRSRRLRASLQPGNSLDVVWRARLEEHLGVWSIELRESRAALLMAQELSLTAMMSAAGVCRLLPERDVCRAVYDGLENLLGGIVSGDLDCWARYVSWELELLRELGYG